ncbi:hypothetical protein [Croceicoccus bisphenolivorans]|uniref:hypothetical protein n=1 Tax=Croceicoccus bisphenolivorans TaxID=1783232 RepID=UPI00082FD4B2|nr:hypothetical protein [Croceicoccus bisphenolivorans]
MNDVSHSIRAFLREFRNSPLSEVHVAGDGFEYFLTRRAGSTSPMRGVGEVAEAAVPAAESVVRAPHLALFHAIAAVGDMVACGDRIAELSVLDRTTYVTADRDGTIAAITPNAGLVEYDEELLIIAG